MKKVHVQFFSIALLSFSVLRMVKKGSVTTYIHPSTIWLVALAGAVLLILALGLAFRSSTHSHVTRFQLGAIFLVAIALAISKTVPLSTSLAKQRDSGGVPIASRSSVRVHGLTQNFNVLEWAAAWDGDPTHQKYLGAKVAVSGFITNTNGRYGVARLLITCCVVDAQPVILPITFSGAIPPEGTWVEVKGSMGNNGSKPEVQASSIEHIAIPDQQYVY